MTRRRAAVTPEEKCEKRLARYSEAVRLVEEGKASPQTAEVVALLRNGLNGIEIAELLGLGRSTVYQLLADPHGTQAAARKANGQRPCADCGEPCNKAGRALEPSERCSLCARAKASLEARWKPEAIIEAIQRWAATHGGLPKASDWNTSARRVHPERFKIARNALKAPVSPEAVVA